MPRDLVQVGLSWSAGIDGPFPARVRTNCPAVNDKLAEVAAHRKRAVAGVIQELEATGVKLTKARLAKLESRLCVILHALSGEAWRCAVLAERSGLTHKKSGERYATRNDLMCAEMLKLITRKKNRLTVEQAAVEVSKMTNANGTPRFTRNDAGKTRLDDGAIKAALYRKYPQGLFPVVS